MCLCTAVHISHPELCRLELSSITAHHRRRPERSICLSHVFFGGSAWEGCAFGMGGGGVHNILFSSKGQSASIFCTDIQHSLPLVVIDLHFCPPFLRLKPLPLSLSEYFTMSLDGVDRHSHTILNVATSPKYLVQSRLLYEKLRDLVRSPFCCVPVAIIPERILTSDYSTKSRKWCASFLGSASPKMAQLHRTGQTSSLHSCSFCFEINFAANVPVGISVWSILLLCFL